jgi:catechol 2,3-dioxygenase-like lactoylglutathione lyase family enzyme
MDHCLLYGGDIDGNRKLFEKVLGFNLVERVKLEDGETDLAIWLTCSAKAHDIAMVRHGEDDKLHHVAFQLASWEQVLRAADIMSMNRVSIDIGPTRHGITRGTTIYFFDPSGNRLETFCGGYDFYPDMHPITWTWDEVGRGDLLPRPQAQRRLPERGDLSDDTGPGATSDRGERHAIGVEVVYPLMKEAGVMLKAAYYDEYSAKGGSGAQPKGSTLRFTFVKAF